MIFEVSFMLAGGINLGLEKSWKLVEDLMQKYPGAKWKKRVNPKKGEGTYIVTVN